MNLHGRSRKWFSAKLRECLISFRSFLGLYVPGEEINRLNLYQSVFLCWVRFFDFAEASSNSSVFDLEVSLFLLGRLEDCNGREVDLRRAYCRDQLIEQRGIKDRTKIRRRKFDLFYYKFLAERYGIMSSLILKRHPAPGFDNYCDGNWDLLKSFALAILEKSMGPPDPRFRLGAFEWGQVPSQLEQLKRKVLDLQLCVRQEGSIEESTTKISLGCLHGNWLRMPAMTRETALNEIEDILIRIEATLKMVNLRTI